MHVMCMSCACEHGIELLAAAGACRSRQGGDSRGANTAMPMSAQAMPDASQEPAAGWPKRSRCLPLAASDQDLLADWPACRHLQSLPPQPPCAWRLSKAELAAELARISRQASRSLWGQARLASWPAEVAKARVAVQQQAEAMQQRYGDFLGIRADDVAWALGQVRWASMYGMYS